MWRDVGLAVGVAAGAGVIVLCIKRRKQCKQNSEVPPPNEGRQLGCLEQMLVDCSDLGTFHTSRILIVSSKQPVTKSIVQQALKRLTDIHPPLRARIAWHEGQPWMVPVENALIDLEEMGTTDWKRVIEDELLIPFHSTKWPLWRVKFLPNVEYSDPDPTHPYQAGIVISLNHVITDGVGFILLFNDLLTTLADVMEGKPTSISAESGFPPSAEDALQLSKKPGFVQMAINALMRGLFSFQSVRLFLLKLMMNNQFIKAFGSEQMRNPSAEIKTSLLTEEFSAEVTSKLLASCRAHKNTIGLALNTASSYALTTLWPQNGKKAASVPVVSNITFGFRNRELKNTPLATVKLANLVSGFDFTQDVATKLTDTEEFWKKAKELQEMFQSEVQKGKQFDGIKRVTAMQESGFTFKRVLEDMPKLPKNLRSGRASNTVAINNIGNCSYLNRSEDSYVRALACYQAVAAHKCGAVFGNQIVSFEGKMFLTVLYCPHVVSSCLAKQYVENLKEILNLVANAA